MTSFGVQVFQQPHNGSVCQPACSLSQSELQVQLKDQLLLDSASTIDATIMNPDKVHNIRPNKKPIVMATNAGEMLLDKVATMPGQGNVTFNGIGMANVLGLSAMVAKHRVTMDTAVENAFLGASP